MLTAVLAAVSSPVHAGDISVAWDPVTDSDLDGYRVEWGTAPGTYSFQQDLGAPTTEVTVVGLTDCTDWHVAVRAFDTAGNFSATFSNEVSGWPRPTIASAGPAAAEQGQALDVAISGTNFRSGATVEFSNAGITVNSVTVVSCTELIASISIDSAATVGAAAISVTNPDQTFGTTADLFSVDPFTADTVPPVLSAVAAGSIGATSALITWATDEAADSQVSYRVQGQVGFQSTEPDAALVTGHAVLVQGLLPATSYEFHVRSADAAGNVSTSADNVFATTPSSFVYLRFEAESGDLAAPVRVTAGTGVFDDAWIDTPAGTPTGSAGSPSGTATYGINLPVTDTWHLWVRMYGPDPANDSFFESIDGAARQVIYPDRPGEWRWTAGSFATLSAGQHVLELGGREALARADRILLTNDPDFVPTEQPVGDTTPPAAPSGAAATPRDGAISLSWTNPPDPDLVRLVIRYRIDGVFPTSPIDGTPLVDRAAVAGVADSELHAGLANDTLYTYSIFAVDSSGNVSAAAQVASTPVDNVAPASVINLRRTDMIAGP